MVEKRAGSPGARLSDDQIRNRERGYSLVYGQPGVIKVQKPLTDGLVQLDGIDGNLSAPAPREKAPREKACPRVASRQPCRQRPAPEGSCLRL